MVDGLPLFGGAQLATLVCPLTRDGVAKLHAATMSGACLAVARRRKEARYPELVGTQGRARLVVLTGEVGGRFSKNSSVPSGPRQRDGPLGATVAEKSGSCCVD